MKPYHQAQSYFPTAHKKTPLLQGVAVGYQDLPDNQVGDEGLEPNHISQTHDKNLQKSENKSAAKSGALQINCELFAGDLEKVINAWPKLSKKIRSVILQLVQDE